MSEYEQTLQDVATELGKYAKIKALVDAGLYEGDALTFYAHVIAIVKGEGDV
ncbi:hypothetical protein [Listeria booriae]|uniref:Uncharacterized protein n=1 Tax=Listeria booriae TaxID=1552123 RepID=A0A7X0TKW6_9LIST|nr:hypothetical protein [Listeria booriae]MBC1331069.1 hypothetical protein [Listeria booriae]MBC2386380.1 hypothetical protein [Listeria booriae]